MLIKSERDLIATKLATALAAGASAQNVIGGLFGVDAGPILQAVPTGAPTHIEIGTAVLNHCLFDRWTRNPSLLEVLLNALIVRGEADLVPLRDRVRQRIDPNLGLLATSWITAELPFFGRATARTFVNDLLNSGSRPILRVLGASKSGKTYTSTWLDYLGNAERCDFRVVIQKLAEGSGPSMAPDTFASSLVAKMTRPIDTIPQPKEGHRYEQALCAWILSNALLAAGRTWIILDGFDDPDLHDSTAALIQLLAEEVLTGDFNRRVRLVLLDFRSNLTQVDDVRVGEEQLSDPATLTSAELKGCLAQHFQDINQAVDDQFLTALAAQVISETNALRADPRFASWPWLKLLNHSLYSLRQRDLRRLGRIA